MRWDSLSAGLSHPRGSAPVLALIVVVPTVVDQPAPGSAAEREHDLLVVVGLFTVGVERARCRKRVVNDVQLRAHVVHGHDIRVIQGLAMLRASARYAAATRPLWPPPMMIAS